MNCPVTYQTEADHEEAIHPNHLAPESVMSRTGLSRSTVYALLKDGKFPKAVRLSLRTVGWLEHEVEAWIAERIHASRESAAE